jgi:hypothetical protein
MHARANASQSQRNGRYVPPIFLLTRRQPAAAEKSAREEYCAYSSRPGSFTLHLLNAVPNSSEQEKRPIAGAAHYGPSSVGRHIWASTASQRWNWLLADAALMRAGLASDEQH